MTKQSLITIESFRFNPFYKRQIHPTAFSLDELWKAAVGINPVMRPTVLSFWKDNRKAKR